MKSMKRKDRRRLPAVITMRNITACCMVGLAIVIQSHAAGFRSHLWMVEQDTLKSGAEQDSVNLNFERWKSQREVRRIHFPLYVPDSVDVPSLRRSPYLSIQQVVKGNVAGLYVQEPSGEPGTLQSMLLRGTSVPLFTKNAINDAQPAVYINGVPMAQDRSYSSVIQGNDVNPLGTATNLLAGLDINNIVSLEVIKDPVKLALLGPQAANGAIWIVTKEGFYGGKHMTVDASMSFVTPMNSVRMTNAADERNFRSDFYPMTGSELENYLPSWLADRSDAYFFGRPDWADDYYRSAAQYNLNVSIGSGGQTANYLFTLGTSSNAGIADNTGYNKYNLGFYLNLLPFRGMVVSTMIQAAKVGRTRNTSLRDRYAEIEYLPQLLTPIAPTADAYNTYRSYIDDVEDENNNANINGALQMNYVWHHLRADVGLKFDYHTNVRHLFYPSTLMESVNYVSDYSGYNRRFIGEAGLGYDFDFGRKHLLAIDWRGTLQEDRYHYNYSRGYDGSDDNKPTTNGGDYEILRYLDQETIHLMSSAFSLNYRFSDVFTAHVVLRQDGASSVQADSRWLFTPAAGISLNLKQLLFGKASRLSALNIGASWARIGRLLPSDRYSRGPQYTSENIGWGAPLVGSYSGLASISRPYRYGWMGYGISWPYSDKLEVRIDGGLWDNRLRWNLALYENREHDLMVQLPVAHEFGYDYQWKQGMDITNRGAELTLSATPVRQLKGWTWDFGFNFAYNHNELAALPQELAEAEVNGRLLRVGSPVDQFYVLQNTGIYTSAEEVPQKDGRPLSINGTALQAGDPKWVDTDGDNRITDADKVMKGNSIPRFTGGFNTTLRYKRFDLGLNFFYALRHEAMNYRAYQQYDFTTLDKSASLDAVREIFFWQDGNLPTDYPRYNALSKVHPYRADQDLYMESLSYLKLRSATLGYTLPLGKGKKASELYLYLTGNNLFTLSGFSGDDPELVDFDGYYRGYGMLFPRSFTLGARYKF